MMTSRRCRPGTTLVELLLFLAALAVASVGIMQLLWLATEQNVRQQTVTNVEQSITQLQQLLEYQVRHAERVLDPRPQGSGQVLALSGRDAATSPVIVGAVSGSLLLMEGATEYALHGDEIVIPDFRVWRVTATGSSPAVRMRFSVRQRRPIPGAPVYERTVDTSVALFPDDRPTTVTCGAAVCGAPSCNIASHTYRWEACVVNSCVQINSYLRCGD